jgi:hypothetical protein
MKRAFILLGVLAIVTLAVVFRPYLHAAISPLLQKLRKQQTTSQRIEQYGEAARARLKPHFTRAGVPYPPQRVTLLGLKEERVLHVYAAETGRSNRWIRSYSILAASGQPGPKLREGDRQVPEGIYPVESLNPNSRFHLSLRLGYPNAFDREQAAKEDRTNLGGDIMIHGSSVSIGCLAMGDEAAEDLFVLAAETGLSNLTAIIAPHDFRARDNAPKSDRLPSWADVLYAQIKVRLAELPSPHIK